LTTAVPSSALIALATFAALPASAQTGPYSLGASQRFSHYSNLFQSTAGPVADTQSVTSLTVGLDQPFGRQRLTGSLSASLNRYQDNSQLNNESYALRAGWDWSTVNNISLSLRADASQSLGDFSPAGLPSITTRNLVTTQGFGATARQGVVTRLTTEASYSHRRTRNSNTLFGSRDLNVDEGSLGVRYRLGGSTNVGAALRLTRGEYPSYTTFGGQTLAETYRNRNLDFSGDWQPSGASRLSGRVSLGQNTFGTDTVRDFSGITYNLGWAWQPSGRLSFNTSVTRESGDEATTLPVSNSNQVGNAVNRVRNGLSLSGSYALSAKIALNASASTSSGTVVTPATGASGRERSQRVALGVVWDPTRTIRTGCDLSRETRDASNLVTAYDADVFGCFAQLTLR
jgi:hypothetical protein